MGEKEMSLSEAVAKLKKYNHCLEVTLNIGHGTAESAEVCEALKVVLKTYDEITIFLGQVCPKY